MELLELQASECQHFTSAVEKEWLETNGLGGFSSSTIIGANTRRYHGLLTAALNPPMGRFLLLSKLEEVLEIGDQSYPLSCNIYFNAVHPDGFSRQTRFSLDPFPGFEYRIGDLVVRKRIMLIHGENTVIVSYTIDGLGENPGVKLTVKPLLAFRAYHCLTHANDGIDRHIDVRPGRLAVKPYPGLPELFFHHSACTVQPTGYWYRNFEYPAEARRGLDYREDLFNPCQLVFEADGGQAIHIAATTEGDPSYPVETRVQGERARRASLVAAWPGAECDRRVAMLVLAGDSFLAKIPDKGSGQNIVAGYHWFGDWGRDTLIALPGLTLCPGKFDQARVILETHSRWIRDGLVPNFLADGTGEALYNSVDASLWFINAVYEYARHTSDFDTVKSWFMDPLRQIIDRYRQGTRFQIRMDGDGLIAAGAPGLQLTWMDAKIDDWVVTQRQGKPVEVEALWYNALRIMESFSHRFGLDKEAKQYSEIRELAYDSFNELFFNEDTGCLFDVVDGEAKDPSIRPNQIFAVSLPFPVLRRDRWSSVMAVVERDLLTPFGLRTLAPSDPDYRGRYEGNQASRDAAYHQGTVWPWLLGPYVVARLRAESGDKGRVAAQIRDTMEALLTQLGTAGLGTLSEICDGDPPHRPRGAISQAWSVAEILRVLHDHLAPLLKGDDPGEVDYLQQLAPFS